MQMFGGIKASVKERDLGRAASETCNRLANPGSNREQNLA
jgi:hypothetical protein